MKYILVVLMACLPLTVAAVLARQPTSLRVPETAVQRKIELHELRLERREIDRKMALLEAEGGNFLPR